MSLFLTARQNLRTVFPNQAHLLFLLEIRSPLACLSCDLDIGTRSHTTNSIHNFVRPGLGVQWFFEDFIMVSMAPWRWVENICQRRAKLAPRGCSSQSYQPSYNICKSPPKSFATQANTKRLKITLAPSTKISSTNTYQTFKRQHTSTVNSSKEVIDTHHVSRKNLTNI